MNANQYKENIAMALGTLRSHKMRSVLTVLGVIIGVMTVIVIASILTGMRSSVIGLVEQYGTHNIYAFHLTTGPQIGHRNREEWQRKPLKTEDAAAIKNECSSVQDVGYFGFQFGNPNVQYKGERFRNAQLQGVSPSLAAVTNVSVSEGRFVSPVDDLRRNNVAVIGVNIVEALFPFYDTVVGRTMLIDGNQYIPYRTMRKVSPRSDFVLIVANAKEGHLGRALDEIEAVLRRQRGVPYDESNDFDLTTSDQFVEQFDQITSTIGLAAIAISGVGLLVGGIGVMNIMLVSVKERTREIGIRKAIGAKRKDIVFQFLFEAITLSTSGGIIGIILAVVCSYVILWFLPDMPASIPMWAVVTGFSVSLSVGLIFGVWPAVKASKLDPIESLRYE